MMIPDPSTSWRRKRSSRRHGAAGQGVAGPVDRRGAVEAREAVPAALARALVAEWVAAVERRAPGAAADRVEVEHRGPAEAEYPAEVVAPRDLAAEEAVAVPARPAGAPRPVDRWPPREWRAALVHLPPREECREAALPVRAAAVGEPVPAEALASPPRRAPDQRRNPRRRRALEKAVAERRRLGARGPRRAAEAVVARAAVPGRAAARGVAPAARRKPAVPARAGRRTLVAAVPESAPVADRSSGSIEGRGFARGPRSLSLCVTP